MFHSDFLKTFTQTCGSTAWLINPDFLPCPFLYVFVVITITQRRRALSAKAWCSLPSIHLRRLRAFPPYRAWSSFLFPPSLSPSLLESACGLKLLKCSLLRTSCLITYLLDLLSCIFSLKDKLKEKCRLSSSHGVLGDLRELKKTLVLINNSQMIACIRVKSLEDTGVAVTKAIFFKNRHRGKENYFSLHVYRKKEKKPFLIVEQQRKISVELLLVVLALRGMQRFSFRAKYFNIYR